MFKHWEKKVVLLINVFSARKHENNVFMYKCVRQMCAGHGLRELKHYMLLNAVRVCVSANLKCMTCHALSLTYWLTTGCTGLNVGQINTVKSQQWSLTWGEFQLTVLQFLTTTHFCPHLTVHGPPSVKLFGVQLDLYESWNKTTAKDRVWKVWTSLDLMTSLACTLAEIQCRSLTFTVILVFFPDRFRSAGTGSCLESSPYAEFPCAARNASRLQVKTD